MYPSLPHDAGLDQPNLELGSETVSGSCVSEVGDAGLNQPM